MASIRNYWAGAAEMELMEPATRRRLGPAIAAPALAFSARRGTTAACRGGGLLLQQLRTSREEPFFGWSYDVNRIDGCLENGVSTKQGRIDHGPDICSTVRVPRC
jgi:hypothetical protein